jgi:HK97 family phage prohead protease
MPDPAGYASEDEWMAACVPTMMDEGRDQDQAVAACLQMWRDKAALPLQTRAYSVLTVKSIDAERREIEGIATTPTVDRVGDVVESTGGRFKLPIPLLHHHKNDQPVGQVTHAKATKDGISIKAKLARVTEPGALKDRIDLAWGEIKAGLVRGLSIGFKPVEFEPLDVKNPFGGLRYSVWDLFEVSLVTIPANSDAQISVIRSIDQGLQAASGQTETRSSRPGASGKPVVNLKRKGAREMSKNVAEHISALEAKRAANQARMEEIMAKAMEEGRSTDDAEREDFDTLEREVETIDDDLTRYRKLEKSMLERAKPVTPQTTKTVEEGSMARAGMIRVQDPELPKGIRFARVARCIALAQGNRSEALRIAKGMYASDAPTIAMLDAALKYGEVSDMALKAVVPAGSTSDTQYAGALVTAVSGESGVVGDFLEFLRPRTILGKFGTGGYPALRQVPFRTGLITQHTGGAGYWVGEGAPKPVMRLDLSRRTLTPTKVATIAVITEELLRDSSPSADIVLRDTMAKAIAGRLDSDFIDPAITASGARPASITSGVTARTSLTAGGSVGGGPATRVRQDVQAMLGDFLAADNDLMDAVWIMRATTVSNLSMMTNSLGEPEVWATTVDVRSGGTFLGLPVIVSNYVPAVGSPTGDYVILVDAQSVWFADEGGLQIDLSREATIEMETAPTGAAFTGSPGSVTTLGATAQVSLFQENLVAWRAERTINWALARLNGVSVLASANWGE